MIDTKVSRVRSLLRTLALYAEARGRLLQIEAQEAGSKLSGIVILVVVLCGCLLFGWLLALPALVWLVADSQGWPWWHVALGGAGVHLFLAIVFFFLLKVRLRKLRVFEETLRQFEKDRDLIGNPPPGL
ncbi:phage holin family protein [Prosthecobacter sp. SYSU 5D2]|uniref:phage holin family protein n=1 Tax=Prosthecobacter sp. SYSU 5D2 TaxID=3134134 RepID=UPI0031FE8402